MPQIAVIDLYDELVAKLIELIAFCEQHDIDLDMAFDEAWFRYRGKPDVEEGY